MKFSAVLCLIMFLSSITIAVYSEESNSLKSATKEPTPKTQKSSEEAVEIAIAQVNDHKIYMSDLAREMRMMGVDPRNAANNMNKESFIKFRDQLIESLINQELMYEEGKKIGFEPKDAEVNAEIAKVKANTPNYNQILRMQGLTEEKFAVLVKRFMTMKKLRDEKIQPLAKPVTDDDIKKYYEENKGKYVQKESVRASHILLKTSANSTEQEKAEIRKKMESILQEARNGANFAELAKKYSQCPSAQQGGDLQYFTRGRMVQPFEDAAFALKPGEISDIVETEFGYHIILLQDKKPGRQLSLDEVKDSIEEVLSDKALNDALEEWLKPIREKASIKILLKSDTTPQTETKKQ